MSSKIDIIITTFNRKAVVKAAINSAIQVSPNKVIVVDDASNDGTFEELTLCYTQNPIVHLHRCPRNLGVTGAKNKGFELSNADWVIFLDSDDLLIKENSFEAFKALNHASQYPVVFFRCQNERGDFVGRKFSESVDLKLETYIRYTSYGEALTAINKSLDNNLPYEEKFRGYEGLGCARRIKNHGLALLSKIVFRTYDQSGEHRLSSSDLLLKRAKLLAKGHFCFYKEFHSYMNIFQKVKIIVKIILYSFFAVLNSLYLNQRTP